MINLHQTHVYVSYYNSIEEYINYLEETPRKPGYRDASESNGGDFTGTESLKYAMDLCKYGDTKLASYINELILDVSNFETVNKNRQQYVNDIVGFTPNVPNYVMGIPTNMIRDNRNIIKSKVINIFINLCASAMVRQSTIKKNAAIYVAAINSLEKQGYRCNVWVGDCGSSGSAKYGYAIKIKSDREPLNLTKMAFPLSHPSMLRRLGFKWIETLPVDFTHSGYGQPVDSDSNIRRILKPFFQDRQYVILSVSHNGGQVTDVVERLKKRGMVK